MNRAAARWRTVFLAFCIFLGVQMPAQAQIRVGLSDWPGWVAWYIAEKEGYFKKYGADVKLVWFANYTDSIQALSAGRLDANSQTLSDSLAPFSKNLPLKVVLVNDNSAGNDALLAKPAVKSIKDLKGKTVALEKFTVSHFLLLTALARNGMKESDVRIVNMPVGDAAAAFLTGRVDAAVVWNPWVNRIEQSSKGKALFTSKDMPGLIPDLLVARQASLQAHRKDYIGMIKAWFDVVQFIRQHPRQAAAIMAPVVKMPPKDYAVFLPGTRFFDTRLNLQAMTPGSSPISLYHSGPVMARFLIQHKQLDRAPDLQKFIDASLLKEALGRK